MMGFFRDRERRRKKLNRAGMNKKKTESRRDQEEGGELDSQEEVSPEETKSREVVLG